jgi:hypothetical protein
MVLARGDDHGGALLVQCRDRHVEGLLLERDFDGRWQAVGPADISVTDAREEYLVRRRRVDPDLWIIELDIPDAPQFVVRLTHGG